MPFMASPASCTVAYLTKPNPLEYPDILSVIALAAYTVLLHHIDIWNQHLKKKLSKIQYIPSTTWPNFENASLSPSDVVRLFNPAYMPLLLLPQYIPTFLVSHMMSACCDDNKQWTNINRWWDNTPWIFQTSVELTIFVYDYLLFWWCNLYLHSNNFMEKK